MPTPTPLQLRFREVHERIIQDFDDQSAWLVYADLLLQKNDPRGEVISAAHLPQGDLSQLIEMHSAAMFGAHLADISDGGPFSVQWHHGVVATMKVAVPKNLVGDSSAHRRTRRAFMERMTSFLKLPVCQFVHSFKFSFIGFDGFLDGLFDGILNPAAVRSLEVEALSDENYERWSRKLEASSDPFRTLVGLETLRLDGMTTTVAYAMPRLALPKLRTLKLRNCNFYGPDLVALAGSSLPALETLSIEPYSKMSDLDESDLTAFVAAKRMPALRRLSLKFCDFADVVLEALVGSPLLAQLTHLDLSHSAFESEMLAHPDFAHLESARKNAVAV